MVSALVIGHNTYRSRAEADAYLADSARAAAWPSVAPADRDKALLAAFRIIERQAYLGARAALKVVATASVAAGGSGYAVGHVLTVVGGTGDRLAKVSVTTIGGGGAVTGVQLLDAGLYSLEPSLAGVATTSAPAGGTGCTLNLTTRTQTTLFPRTGLVNKSGEQVSATNYPQEVLDAQCELAFELSQDTSLETQATTGDNIQRVKAGSVEIEKFSPVLGSRFPSVVQELLAPFLGGTGGTGSGAFASGTDVESEFDPCDSAGLTEGWA